MKKIIKLDSKYVVVEFNGKLYSIVHGKIDWVIIGISYSDVTLMSLNVLGNVQYGYPTIVERGIQSVEYSPSWGNSIVRRLCQFNARNFLGDYRVNDATRIPTKEEIESLPVNLRIATLLNGTVTTYWTSSIKELAPVEEDCIWYVNCDGKFDYTFPDRSCGFRPVVTLSQYEFNKMEQDWSKRK